MPRLQRWRPDSARKRITRSARSGTGCWRR
jgi:hypothetical protein